MSIHPQDMEAIEYEHTGLMEQLNRDQAALNDRMMNFQNHAYLTGLERGKAMRIHPDTARLNFMLQKCRKVVAEVMPPLGSGRHDVYVEEGFMSDKRYPAVEFRGAWVNGSHEAQTAQRAAIDLAIAAQQPEAN